MCANNLDDKEMLHYEIIELLRLKQEGSYWDFKRHWHSNKSALLHDIICMANALSNDDRYIIIGVDEGNDYSFVDVSQDENRRTTQNLVDFLREKKFAGGIRPTVYVESLNMGEAKVDVIVVKSDLNVPYYLTEQFEGVRANNIYIRIADTNTPIDKSADKNHVELLWRKHFKLDDSPLNRVDSYLSESENWLASPEPGLLEIDFYKYAPEFTIEQEPDDTKTAHELYCFTQCDTTPHWYLIRIMYYQTTIACMQGIALDGGRYFTSVPKRSGLTFGNSPSWDVSYVYYTLDSLIYKVHSYFLDYTNCEASYAFLRFEKCVLFFESENQRCLFEEYVLENKCRLDELLAKNEDPYMPDHISEPGRTHYRNELKCAFSLKQMLDEFHKGVKGIRNNFANSENLS